MTWSRGHLPHAKRLVDRWAGLSHTGFGRGGIRNSTTIMTIVRRLREPALLAKVWPNKGGYQRPSHVAVYARVGTWTKRTKRR